MLNKTKLELLWILGEDTTKAIEGMEAWFLAQMKPKKLHGEGNFESAYDKEFEESCYLLSPYTNKDAKTLTVTEFYIIILSLKKVKKK